MNENNKDAAMAELLKNVPTKTLIDSLRTRKLTVKDVATLQSFRPTESINVSQAIIETEGVKEISSAEKFAKAVVRKNVEGKLPFGSKVNGTEIVRKEYEGGFFDHGPNQQIVAEFGPVRNLQSVIYVSEDRLPNLVGSHLVDVAPSKKDDGNSVLTIYFFQDEKQIDYRGWTPAHVSAELPKKDMTELLSAISMDPDLLEDFYQKTFVGLDSQNNLPGMLRVKADGFFIIPAAKLEEADRIKRYDDKGIETFFNSLEKHHYQNGPYGTGDAFKPRKFLS
jgi:hypothetical protein